MKPFAALRRPAADATMNIVTRHFSFNPASFNLARE
jgi:hypothetical protein